MAEDVATLQEQLAASEANLEILQERLAELELSLEDLDWIRLGWEGEREFSREGLKKIIALSRLMFLKNPLVNRAVNVQASYVFGQGVNVEATDEQVNEVVQAFLDDPKNQTELTSHQARMLKEVDLQVLGNLFFVFFTDPASGAVRVRTIPVEEVTDVVTNPEDAKDPWFYRRVWTERGLDGQTRTRITYYPDWRYADSAPNKPTFSDGEMLWETPVFHLKVGGLSDMRFGVPEVYQAIDWGRAYTRFLEDRATVARALSRFAWNLSTPGGKAGIAAAKAKLGTTVGATAVEGNPPPVTGSVFVAGQGGATLDPIRVAGATINPDEGRRFLLMVCAAVGLPETFFGDVSVGTLATSKSLDRPTELKFRDRQQLWSDALHDILQFVIEQSIKAPGGLSESVDRTVDVSFPDILERDADARVKSIISAATLDGQTPVGTMDDRTLMRLLLQALGLDDVDELLDKLAPEGGESLIAQLARQKMEQAQELADRQAQARGQQQGQGERPPQEDQQQEAFVEAVRELRAAVAKLEVT